MSELEHNDSDVRLLAKPQYLPSNCVGAHAPYHCENESLFVALLRRKVVCWSAVVLMSAVRR